MKEAICRAFCESVTVSDLPGGYGISSVLLEINGDPAAFYAMGPDASGQYRLDDGGQLMPALAASGFDPASNARRAAVDAIIESVGGRYDEDLMEFCQEGVREEDLPASAIRFLAALTRIGDL